MLDIYCIYYYYVVAKFIIIQLKFFNYYVEIAVFFLYMSIIYKLYINIYSNLVTHSKTEGIALIRFWCFSSLLIRALLMDFEWVV